MKMKLSHLSILAVLACAFSLTSCVEDQCQATYEYVAYEPVYIVPEEIRHPIEAEPARALENPGKIYVYQNYLFINEREKGIHIYDNSDPASPTPIRFLNIPGNVDMAVRNGMLYADHYIDLVAIDIRNPEAPVFAGRTTDVFPNHGVHQDLGIIVQYKATDVTEQVPCDEFNGQPSFWRDDLLFIGQFASNDVAVAAESGSQQSGDVGIGGSMARFTMAMDHLYVVDDSRLHVFDLSTPEQAQLANTVPLGWGIETIFPLEDKLFIGANNGMHIYDNSNPTQPVFLSTFRHATACDPVFVDGDVAYVTLRSGQPCETFTNQLDVVDVSDLTAPKLIQTFPMHNPHGLSKHEQALFICENNEGVKVFDATDNTRVGFEQIARMSGFQAYDIITLPARKLALVIGEDGFYQFDIQDASNPQLISEIHAP
jgi:hypothetical protein